MLLCPVVEGTLVTPPANPTAGSCYLVATGATGAWSGQTGSLACYTDGGWRFVAPIEGTSVLNQASGEMIVRRGGSWETGIVRAQELRINGQTLVRERQPAVADPIGGSIVDGECRAAVSTILTSLRAHGLIA